MLLAVCVGGGLRLWLAGRQIAAVQAHREQVPEPFAREISAAEHHKAADYTMASVRLSRLSIVIDAIVALALTIGGVIAAVDGEWSGTGWQLPWRGLAVIGSVLLLTALLDLPLSVWRTFRHEARFGFNRTSPRLFVIDLLKSLLLAVVLGAPVVLGMLTLMAHAGRLWWLYAWCGWLALMLLMSWAWPALVAPLFNRFAPLQDAVLKARIEALLARCGFTSKGVFVVDGSRRSAHGNAYFTGIGSSKRIVFFDTLLERLNHDEVEAVLAHELGHFRLHHVRKRLVVTVVTSLLALATLGWIAAQPAFYGDFGIPSASSHAALLLFLFIAPAITFFVTPLGSLWSRRHEFEADAFAAQHADAAHLANALVKLYRDNASTLTPDPVYSAFYYSHPPALERIARLRPEFGTGRWSSQSAQPAHTHQATHSP